MTIASTNRVYAPLVIALLSVWMTATTQAQIISFEYTQTDKDTGSGTLSGLIDGIFFTGVMPAATVSQVDENNRPVPEGYIGYMDGWQEAQPGNPYGVHIGWSGSVTLTGERVASPTELELLELEIPLVLDQAADATWRYETTLTDDGKGNGNDAFGTGLRIAGWIGDKGDGHRHSADAFGDWVEGQVDSATVVGTHGDIGDNGRGDELGIGISLRNANGSPGPFSFDDPEGNGTGVIYVDDVIWQGGFTVDLAANAPTVVGTALAADFNADTNVDFSDFQILAASFNMDGTTREGGGDMTGDGRTDLHDWVLFRAAYAAAQGGGAAAVPEPATCISLLLGFGLLSLTRRKRTCVREQ